MSEHELPDDARRRYRTPYTDKRKIPTISGYREEQELRQERAKAFEDRNTARDSQQVDSPQDLTAPTHDESRHGNASRAENREQDQGGLEDTSEATAGATDPKQRMKERKKGRDEAAEREVTDPVTHLPVRIRDYTDEALKEVSENQEQYGSTGRTATGLSNKSKSSKELDEELRHLREEREAMQALFPPPDFDAVKLELAEIYRFGLTVVVVGMAVAAAVVFAVNSLLDLGILQPYIREPWVHATVKWAIRTLLAAGGMIALVLGVRDWVTRRVDAAWEAEIWQAKRDEQQVQSVKNRDAESVAWLNSLMAAVWPLVNPDLFTSLADTLEDVMQASLPKFVRMVSVEDIGQGSESIQILGIKWLPTGAAALSVTEDGDLKKDDEHSDRDSGDQLRKDSGQDSNITQDSKDKDQQDDGTQQPMAQGLEAEEGDYVNVELAFAYRARSKTKSMSQRSKYSHIYLAFYLPGNIKVPVWVELRGLVGSLRMRLQLCPDPPFFSLCTLTFLGQPKVSMSCVPLSKYAINIMDAPLISNFVQSAVDAAMAEYVAPKSLNLDLKDMLAGDDFKKDTSAYGVLVVNIKRGYDFRQGDAGIPLVKDGGSDPYVSVGWAKFGKPVWSTRMLMNEMEPYWDETCYVLVTQQEVNVDERLRVQLWDSDRVLADDDLGRIEVDLNKLMTGKESKGQMWHRCDGFRALKAGEEMPGKLEWSVGYYAKTPIQPDQLSTQSFDSEVRSVDQLKDKVDAVCARKLREANIKQGRHKRDRSELAQQKAQEFKAREDAMIISAPPPQDYPSGIFSIQIHQITGLELAKLSKDAGAKDAEASDEEEAGEGLPSAYCNIIVNHKKVFKTRTKPANAKPFFNAGTERYIADWREAEVHVSVRDARVKEEDPLLGIVRLPLREVFAERAQVNGFFPLVGGVGYGRVRISMVWRSVELQAPAPMRGWDHGTLVITPRIGNDGVNADLRQLKLKFQAPLGKGKMYALSDSKGTDDDGGGSGGGWTTQKHQRSHHHRQDPRPLRLGVRMRHSSPLTIGFEDPSFFSRGDDKAAAFCVFWLKDLPDGERQTLTLPVWKGDFERARTCCLPDSEVGEKVGEIEVEMALWPGLGRAHRRWAKKDRNVRNVAEVLETARDNYEGREFGDDGHGHGHEEREAGGNSSDSDVHSVSTNDESEADEEAPSGGIKKTASDFKKKQESLGRRHRGIMQWRLPRTAKWGANKVQDLEGKFNGMFKHGQHGGRGEGVETEV